MITAGAALHADHRSCGSGARPACAHATCGRARSATHAATMPRFENARTPFDEAKAMPEARSAPARRDRRQMLAPYGVIRSGCNDVQMNFCEEEPDPPVRFFRKQSNKFFR